jgi:hypothetical protein
MALEHPVDAGGGAEDRRVAEGKVDGWLAHSGIEEGLAHAVQHRDQRLLPARGEGREQGDRWVWLGVVTSGATGS